MNGIAIVTDSTADLGTLAAGYGIEVVPLTIAFGAEQYRDGIDLSMDEFYAKLQRDPRPPVTAQPPPAAFAEVYRRLLARGASGIVSLHLSSALSGTYNSAVVAAREVDAERIAVVDTRSVSLGLGLVAIGAAENARRGLDLQAVVEQARTEAAKVELYATIPSLTYLARGGRIGQLRSIVGNVLKIVPIITLREGAVAEYGKVRTFPRAVDQVVDITIGKIRSKGTARCAVLHAAAADLANSVAQRIRDAVQPTLMIVNSVGPTVGTHAGPGAVGAIFIQ
ncbi:MAG TPA: DegV family protein [Candidatus Eremiobacteraceae bacterium]|nr:DegV family protein [Candidatus Eremiobacteraceae bacterium]